MEAWSTLWALQIRHFGPECEGQAHFADEVRFATFVGHIGNTVSLDNPHLRHRRFSVNRRAVRPPILTSARSRIGVDGKAADGEKQ